MFKKTQLVEQKPNVCDNYKGRDGKRLWVLNNQVQFLMQAKPDW